jgi:vacuolar-type H+-ATPase subunit I/STV1
MSMLIEKRNELMARLSALETARQIEIDAKVAEYRKAIEAQYPTDNIDKVKAVISALDEVISYENATNVSQSVEPIAEPVEEVQHVVETQPRPGMATVFTPSRT